MAKEDNKVSYAWEDRKEWLDMPFPEEEYEKRVHRLRQIIADKDLNGILIHGNPGDSGPLHWVANFNSFVGDTILVIGEDADPAIVTDSVFHSEPMHTQIWSSWIKDVRADLQDPNKREGENVTDLVLETLSEQGNDDGRLGLVTGRGIPHRIYENLESNLPDADFVNVDAEFKEAKTIRSKNEVELLRDASLQVSRGLDAAMEAAEPGMTENELAAIAVEEMFRHGAHDFAYPMVTTAGPRSGFKHNYPTDRVLQEGDLINMDIGANYHGYLSDINRTFILGEGDKEKHSMQETALKAEEAVIEKIEPGMKISELQTISENIASEDGWSDHYYRTGFGHGITTTLIEKPAMHADNDRELEPGMVFAIEPMIVKKGVGTACYEDLIHVTETGADVLSDAKKIISTNELQ